MLLALLLAPRPMPAQQSEPASAATSATASNDHAAGANSTESLQKATQNFVADLISVPLQNSSNFGIGPCDRTQDVLNIQPVIPFSLNDK
jgi:hypothetical protein